MNILVVYYSRSGNTKRVAEDLASILGADIESIEDRKAGRGVLGWVMMGNNGLFKKETVISPIKNNPGDYDLIIIGTPRYVDMSPAVRTYVNKYKSEIRELACFVTAGENKHNSIISSMRELYGKDIYADTGFVLKDFKNSDSYKKIMNDFIQKINECK